jgi:hypothetical protein
MDISNQIEKYINSQNRKIWEELKPHYNFILTYDTSQQSWASKSEGNIAQIVIPDNVINYDAFSHELLHIYMDYLGLSNYPDFIYSIIGENSFGILVANSNLVAHLYNVCSHKKMYPYFKEMGFSEYKFVDERISFNQSDLNIIKNGFQSNHSKALYIDLFIGHSLTLLNNVVEEDKSKCQNFLLQLKAVNGELFKIIEDFDNEWENSKDLNLLELFLKFEKRLDDWLSENNLTFDNDYYC